MRHQTYFNLNMRATYLIKLLNEHSTGIGGGEEKLKGGKAEFECAVSHFNKALREGPQQQATRRVRKTQCQGDHDDPEKWQTLERAFDATVATFKTKLAESKEGQDHGTPAHVRKKAIRLVGSPVTAVAAHPSPSAQMASIVNPPPANATAIPMHTRSSAECPREESMAVDDDESHELINTLQSLRRMLDERQSRIVLLEQQCSQMQAQAIQSNGAELQRRLYVTPDAPDAEDDDYTMSSQPNIRPGSLAIVGVGRARTFDEQRQAVPGRRVVYKQSFALCARDDTADLPQPGLFELEQSIMKLLPESEFFPVYLGQASLLEPHDAVSATEQRCYTSRECIAMEHIDGCTLHDLLMKSEHSSTRALLLGKLHPILESRRQQPQRTHRQPVYKPASGKDFQLPQQRDLLKSVIAVMRKFALALAELHKVATHCDLKPANIMVSVRPAGQAQIPHPFQPGRLIPLCNVGSGRSFRWVILDFNAARLRSDFHRTLFLNEEAQDVLPCDGKFGTFPYAPQHWFPVGLVETLKLPRRDGLGYIEVKKICADQSLRQQSKRLTSTDIDQVWIKDTDPFSYGIICIEMFCGAVLDPDEVEKKFEFWRRFCQSKTFTNDRVPNVADWFLSDEPDDKVPFTLAQRAPLKHICEQFWDIRVLLRNLTRVRLRNHLYEANVKLPAVPSMENVAKLLAGLWSYQDRLCLTYGLYEKVAEGDGRCMFRSLVGELQRLVKPNWSEEQKQAVRDHDSLRLTVVEYLKSAKALPMLISFLCVHYDQEGWPDGLDSERFVQITGTIGRCTTTPAEVLSTQAFQSTYNLVKPDVSTTAHNTVPSSCM
jgi:serine/threonine protein kinase